MTSTRNIPFIQDPDRKISRLKQIPAEPGVYLMRDAAENILYIGKSKKLRSRVQSYFREGQHHSHRIALMVMQVCEIEFIVTDTEAEALALEANLIKQHQPYFNILLKDDKKYPFLCITWSEAYPRVFITRKRQLRNRQDRYYGPYVDSSQLRNTLKLVKRIFPLRQRPQPLFKDRPCLNYDIGRCPGVCQGLISSENYHQTVEKVAMVFQGRTSELIESLTAQMNQAAEALNFEQAARVRDQITGLKELGIYQKVSLPDDTISRDAIALASDGQHTCIQLFQIRAGQLVGRLGFVVKLSSFEAEGRRCHTCPEGSRKQEAGKHIKENQYREKYLIKKRHYEEFGDVLQHILEEHYQNVDPVEIPSEILVQYELKDEDFLASWLSDRKGRKVSVFKPQRQGKAELIEMVERNAYHELARMQKVSDRNIQAMQDLAELLDLSHLPHRIEGYDISHVQGSDAVASRVVFIDGLPAKQYYRHYQIKNPEVHAGHSDDFASMAEVIQRRFRNFSKAKNNSDLKAEEKPDLVMIDGGKGQLSAVVKVLSDLELMEDLRVVSLAKKREEIFLPGESLPLKTDSEQAGVQLLRRVRDEAHRFAVSFHRQKRTKRMRRSRLDEIPGLGHHRQKQLLAYFRSVDYIRIATSEQLAEVPGIGPTFSPGNLSLLSSMNLTPKQLQKFSNYLIVSLILVELAIAVTYLAYIFFTGRSPMIVNMDGARNFPSWLQAMQIFAIGAIALGLGITHQSTFPYPSRKFLFFLTGLLFYAGLDEVFKLHLGFRNLLPIVGTQYWIAIYSSIIGLLPVLFYRDFKAFWQSYRQETSIGLTGLIIFALGGFGGELFKSYLLQPLLANSSLLQSHDFLSLFLEKFRVAIEEGGELLGESIVLYAALLFIAKRLKEKQNYSRPLATLEQSSQNTEE